jgi:hypothetical protein
MYKVRIDRAAVGDYLGATGGSGVLRTDSSLTYTDGGNFVTLALASGQATMNHSELNQLDAASAGHTDFVLDSDFGSAGLMKATDGAGSYTVITDSSSNWDTAYGWGDHSGLYVGVGDSFVGDVTGTYAATVVEDFALTSDADAGDFDIDSLDRLEFLDAGLYIDGGTDGTMVISSDGTLTIANTTSNQDITFSFNDGGQSRTFFIDASEYALDLSDGSLYAVNAELTRDLGLFGGDDSDFYIYSSGGPEWFHITPDGSGNITVDAAVGTMTLSDSGNSITIAEAEAAHNERGSQVGGTNLTWDGSELDVDDAFLVNNASDETTGTITAAGFTTVAGTVSAEQITSTDDASITGTLSITDATPIDLAANTSTITYGDAGPVDYLYFNSTATTGLKAGIVAFGSTEHAGTLALTHTTTGSAFVATGDLSFTSSTGTISFTASTAGKSITLTSPDVLIQGLTSFKGKSTLSISSGSITPTRTYHAVDTEDDDPSDLLATIVASKDGQIVIIRPLHDDRTVIIDDGADNIVCGKTGGDVTLDDNTDTFMAVYDITLTKWLEL